ncbi:MAG: methylmalonyl Co-A mutase-associated GTPase MeaB [Candidatus Cloacimonetes bacterium HGW-Cloacimonetes-1]|jgi:LAO/AO transport system kinase|nr:MAG: methylmalonyl Co-A mutase-associated GTPase MeaB [Candidatus Cloacimonetes bacterium HGW-Cloacimonetes-1]
MNTKDRKPEWVPQDAGKEFTTNVMPGQADVSNISTRKVAAMRSIDTDTIVKGVLSGNRTILAKAITLIESNSLRHFDQAQAIVNELLPYSGNSLRIGITGTPGAGKSTFIESFGLWLIELGHKVAVLAIDPSSSISKGSVLGDKTRMEKLSRADESFIRPSPSSGVLGGVARKTRETIILCEAAGYDIILIETVGVGQSEITVRSMVDFFCLMQISGAGDELQGIKKGIMELADLLLINKADGDNITRANIAAQELNNALHYLQAATAGWQTKAITCSALHHIGLQQVWDSINEFMTIVKTSGTFEQRRNQQTVEWFEALLTEAVMRRYHDKKDFAQKYHALKDLVAKVQISPSSAVHELLGLM